MLFSKYERLFLDQANSNSDSSQILILQFPISRAFMPPWPSLPNFTLTIWNPSSTQSSSCSLSVSPYLVLTHSTTHYHKYCIHGTIFQVKPIKFIIKPHITISYGSNMLPIKKAEFLRAASLLKLNIMVKNNSVFNKKYAKFSTKW